MGETAAGADRDVARGHLVRLVFGGMAAQVIGSATRLGLADAIGDGVRTVGELAAETGRAEQPLRRLLRALAALEILAEEAPDRFRLATAGELLRTDRPDSVHAMTRMFTDPTMLSAWQHLDTSLRTGETAFDTVFGTDFFSHLSTDPDLSALFNAAMSQGTREFAEALPRHFDFGRFGTVADIGGGDGTLIAPILRAHSGLRGIVFDTADGSAQAAASLEGAGVADRCEVTTGDFFTGVPAGADLYVLKSIVHDWDDDRAATILGHCRKALPATGRVLIIEPVLPDVVEPGRSPISYLSDLNMLVNVGGRERTREDFTLLCERAGLSLIGIGGPGAGSGYRLIEAAPA